MLVASYEIVTVHMLPKGLMSMIVSRIVWTAALVGVSMTSLVPHCLGQWSSGPGNAVTSYQGCTVNLTGENRFIMLSFSSDNPQSTGDNQLDNRWCIFHCLSCD